MKFAELDKEAQNYALRKMEELELTDEWYWSVYEMLENDLIEIGLGGVELSFEGIDYYRQVYIKAYVDDFNLFLSSEFAVSALEIAMLQKIMEQEHVSISFRNHHVEVEVPEEYSNYLPSNRDLERWLLDKERDFFKDLQGEYSHITSTENLIEVIEANDYDFAEDGSLK